MPRKIFQILRGLASAKPSLSDGEMYLEKDTDTVVIKNDNDEVRLANKTDISSLESSISTINGNIFTISSNISSLNTEVDSKITQSQGDARYLQLSGGTLTGNLTGKYITGTWLQSTADTSYSSSGYRGICVFDSSGWVYSRTKAQILSDIGASSNFANEFSGTLPTSGWTSSSGQYYYQVTISGMTANSIPLVIPQWGSSATTQKTAWSTLTNIQSFAGYVRFYAPSPISTSVPYTIFY